MIFGQSDRHLKKTRGEKPGNVGYESTPTGSPDPARFQVAALDAALAGIFFPC
jgi:hypothetical protein